MIFFALLYILIDESHHQRVQQFYLVLPYRSLDVISADSAVIGNKDIGTTRDYREEAAHELSVLVGTAGSNRNQANAVFGESSDGCMKALDNVILVVSRSVKHQEGDAVARICIP